MIDIVKTDNYALIEGEAICELEKLSDASIDLFCVDLPYGATKNKWDIPIPFDKMWEQFHRLIKPNGAIVLTATQPFTSMLVMSNLQNFKYDIIWEKTVASGQLNVHKQPMRAHEHLLVFSKGVTTYNEQQTVGVPYSIKRKGDYKDGNYNKQKSSEKENTGYRHARSVIKISNPRIKGGHPTQKPTELTSYIIKTFSNKGDIVVDCCMGSGTTGESCGILERRFIGIELNHEYFMGSVERIHHAYDRSNRLDLERASCSNASSSDDNPHG